MTIKLNKTKIIEFNFTGDPDNTLWHRGWNVRLGKRFFRNWKYSFYILIWNKL